MRGRFLLQAGGTRPRIDRPQDRENGRGDDGVHDARAVHRPVRTGRFHDRRRTFRNQPMKLLPLMLQIELGPPLTACATLPFTSATPRSEGRRVGEELVRTYRVTWSPYH